MSATHVFNLAAAALLAIAGSGAAAAQVCFYEHYDYQGASWCSTATEGEVQGPVVDKISSVKVAADTDLLLYQHPGFAGRTVTLSASTPNLDTLGFNNLSSGFRQRPRAAAAPVCFYEHYGFQGASWCSTAAQGNIPAPVADKVSSVRVPANTQVTLYQRAGFAGSLLALGGDTPDLNARGFNNLALSFRRSTGQPAAPSAYILFVGNSFFHGHSDPVIRYNAGNVEDLNGSGYGGVPGIVKQLTVQAGLNYSISSELASGQNLQFHYENRRTQIGKRRWDVVLMQDQSLLNGTIPGTPTRLLTYSRLLEQFVHGSGPQGNPQGNPRATVLLMATWARADQVYNTPQGPWMGKTLEVMNADLRNAYALAAAENPAIAGVLPVGDAFLRAVQQGVADRNPYDGIDAGKVTLWDQDDRFHASTWASYLEALVIFGRLTGIDPRSLGADCQAARDLGLTLAQATTAQRIAREQLSVGTP